MGTTEPKVRGSLDKGRGDLSGMRGKKKKEWKKQGLKSFSKVNAAKKKRWADLNRGKGGFEKKNVHRPPIVVWAVKKKRF